ncbi:MAG: PH domain-containing protein [Candidatus Latescibacterota bacterium]
MQIKYFNPNPKYLIKMRLIITLIAILIMALGVLFGWLIGLDEGPRVGAYVTLGVFLADLLWWLPAMILAGFYYRSLKYEICDDEVIVHVGIWTKSVKHVPYRTVTNLKVGRDIFDRWMFGIGSLNIQTAGMSGSTGAEESLVGLDNVQEAYDLVAAKLRKFRGGMPATAAGSESDTEVATSEVLGNMLAELRAIRQSLDK